MADEKQELPEPCKCEECVPGLPGWMATFADLVTLLLTFFVLLLSFAKTETSKYEAALGSLREAFGGNVFKQGEVIQKGKSPDAFPTMMESQQPIKPYPIDFLTTEGVFDKHEVNRASTESLKQMRRDLQAYSLKDSVTIYEMPEGIKVRIKDKIYFERNSIKLKKGGMAVEVYQRLIKLLANEKWIVFIEGHAAPGETFTEQGLSKEIDAYTLSARRAEAVSRSLMKRGVKGEKITTVFYGSTRPNKILGKDFDSIKHLSQRVEFIVRKADLSATGQKVDEQ